MFDVLLATRGIENFLLEQRVDDQLFADLSRDLRLLLALFSLFTLSEQLFDPAMIGLEQVDGAFRFGL